MPTQMVTFTGLCRRSLLFISLCITGLIATFSFSGCAPSLTMSRGSGNTVSFGPREGMASFYGREFNGRKTASGERFDMHNFTAAHRELPFGAMIKVTNLSNGKSVVVRVNDRGPFTRSRIIDLSFAAAKAIGIDKTGTARVKLEIIKTE